MSVHETTRRVIETLARATARYPPGAAVVEANRVAPSVLQVRPSGGNGAYARLDLEVDPGGRVIYIRVGMDGTLDLPAGKGWVDPAFASYLDAIEQLARAVIEGRVREEVWRTTAGRITRSRVVVELHRGPFPITRGLLVPWRGRPTETIDYSPYPGLEQPR